SLTSGQTAVPRADSLLATCPVFGDHLNTIAGFRQHLLDEIKTLFVQVLHLARVLKLGDRAREGGTIALDGTKIHANASRHSALSYEHAGKTDGKGAAALVSTSVTATWRAAYAGRD